MKKGLFSRLAQLSGLQGSAVPEHRHSLMLLYLILGFCVFFVIWAALTEVEEITRGEGRFVPSQSVQKVQNLEGGILGELLVREGELVQKGQPLLRIDNTTSAAAFAEARGRERHLEATRLRLLAERDGLVAIAFPDVLRTEAAASVDHQTQLFESRRARFQEQRQVIEQQITQRQKEIEELEVRLQLARRNLALARKEYAVSQPLEKNGALSRLELIHLEAKVNTLVGEVETLQVTLPKTAAALAEARSRLREMQGAQQSEILQQLAETVAELDGVRAVLKLGEDRVTRTIVRAPTAGIIKSIASRTTGGVIRPGDDILEIVPQDEALMVEGRIAPADAAFLRPGLPAVIKVAAYDWGRYGALRGTVQTISADTITDTEGGSYYKVVVAVRRDGDAGPGINRLPLLPGMTVVVEVVTGRKSILDYLVIPISRARDAAFTER